jgi:hypothetical protein
MEHATVSTVEEAIKKIKEARVTLTLSLSGSNIGDSGAELLAQSLKVARVPLILYLRDNGIGSAGTRFFAEAIKAARFPLTLNLRGNRIGEAGVALLAQSIKAARVSLTLDVSFNNIGDVGAGLLAEAIKEARVPITLEFPCNAIGDVGAEFLAEATEDNFITDARGNPLGFLSRIKFSPSMRMLGLASDLHSALAKLVQDYIDGEDLAWAEVAAIRAVEGASHENKYSSINYELLNAVYLPKEGVEVVPDSSPDEEQKEDDDQEARGVSSIVF